MRCLDLLRRCKLWRVLTGSVWVFRSAARAEFFAGCDEARAAQIHQIEEREAQKQQQVCTPPSWPVSNSLQNAFECTDALCIAAV